MQRSKKPWEVLLLLAVIAVWQWATPRTAPDVPAPCPPQLRAQHEALSRNLRRTAHIPVWGERHGAKGEWVIVRYTVDGRGRTALPVLVTCSGGDPRLVLAGVKACEPAPPLPAGVRSLEVVELFWDESCAHFAPGSLAAQLHALHQDGRWIRPR